MGCAGAGGRDCTQSGAFEFVHPTGSDSSVQDCITADVCLTRGYAGPLFNAVGVSPAEYPREFLLQWPGDTEEPVGTQWAPSDCASAQPSGFTTFVDALQDAVGDNLLRTPLCLSIPAANLFYDVDFSAWQSGGGGAFAYTRTAASPDECDHGDATCGTACGCPEGFLVDANSGDCRLPDPCNPNPCGSGATCRRIGLADHVCECDTVEFTNDLGSCDSITPSVCIARGSSMGLYNSADEPGYNEVAECGSPSPTLTEWANLPCAEAVNVDFGTWVSATFTDCFPPQMVGVAGCVRLTDGSSQEWDIRMTDWCIGPFRGGGCFSYIRSHNVADGQACEAPLCEGVVCEDDGKECTNDVCNAATGTCDYPPVRDGTECTDGICLNGVCEVLCAANVCQCSELGIRAAINAGGNDPYTFDCDGPRTVVVTNAEIEIDNDVILDGEGNLRVDGNATHRVFSVAIGIAAELRGVIITGGAPQDGVGGGVYNAGVLALTNSTVSGNDAGVAGGILNEGVLTLTNSTVSNNSAFEFGGGILNVGELALTNSTVSGNDAGVDGGGIETAAS